MFQSVSLVAALLLAMTTDEVGMKLLVTRGALGRGSFVKDRELETRVSSLACETGGLDAIYFEVRQ